MNAYLGRDKLAQLLLLVLMLMLGGSAKSAEYNRMDAELIRIYKIAGVNPFDFVAANNLAVKYATEGRYSIAEKLLLRADRLAPGRTDIVENLDMVRRLISQVKNLPPTALEQFSKSFDKQHIPAVPNTWSAKESATQYNDQAVYDLTPEDESASNPFLPDTLIQLADLKMRKGEYRAAMKYLQSAKRLDPFRSDIDTMISRIDALAPENFLELPNYTTQNVDLELGKDIKQFSEKGHSEAVIASSNEQELTIQFKSKDLTAGQLSTQEIPDQWVLE